MEQQLDENLLTFTQLDLPVPLFSFPVSVNSLIPVCRSEIDVVQIKLGI